MTGANDPLVGVARRRSDMEQALQDVEHAAAAPAGGESWLDDLNQAMTQLQTALQNHIVGVETPGALLDQIVERAPRLQRDAEQTKAHHVVLSKAATAILEEIAGARDVDDPPVEDIRSGIVYLLTEITRHRQSGADLIYNAYSIDIGGY
ncbi:MAG: hypothetical protein QNJ77_13255 [Acidimicrobiia bacterium]|nr:hypothetical protein [Acidimicrobiia bacterium]